MVWWVGMLLARVADSARINYRIQLPPAWQMSSRFPSRSIATTPPRMEPRKLFAGNFSPGGDAFSTPIRPQNAKFRTRVASSPATRKQNHTVASGRAGPQLADGEADDTEFDVRDAAIGLSKASTGRAAKKARARGRGSPPHQLLFGGDAVGEPEPADCRVDGAGFSQDIMHIREVDRVKLTEFLQSATK